MVGNLELVLGMTLFGFNAMSLVLILGNVNRRFDSTGVFPDVVLIRQTRLELRVL
jgi:hypothetical protein